MRKSLLVILLCLMLPAFGGISCYAAIKDWDKILDKYEKLCESCLQMKMKAESGEKVSKVSLGRLFSSLSELRGELKSGSGSMSVSQRERFEQIRTRYSSLFGIEETQDEAEKPESPPVKKEVHKTISAAASSRQQGSAGHIATRINETKVEEDTLARERLPLSELPRIEDVTSIATALASKADSLSFAAIKPYALPREAVLEQRSYSKSVSALLSTAAEGSYGAAAAIIANDNAWGAYIKFHSNFKPYGASYHCDSDGSCDNGQFWPSGDIRLSYFQTSAGVRKDLGHHFGVLAGAGYGRKTVLWEDIDNNWAMVNDQSFSGLLLECGPIVHFGPMELQISISTINFKTAALDFGVGLRF